MLIRVDESEDINDDFEALLHRGSAPVSDRKTQEEAKSSVKVSHHKTQHSNFLQPNEDEDEEEGEGRDSEPSQDMDVVQPIKIAKDLDSTYSQMTERQRVQVMEALVSYMINNLNKSPANVKFFEVRRDKDSQKKLQALQAYNKTMTLAPNFQPQQLDLLQDLLLDLFSYQVKSGAVPQLVNMKKMVTDSKAAGETKVFNASAFEACFTLDSNAEMFRHVCRLLLKM